MSDSMVESISKFLEQQYGLQARLSPLAGYEDLNFLAEVDGKPAYVVKVSTDPEMLDLLRAQEEILQKLSGTGEFRVPSVIRDPDGRSIHPFGEQHLIRVLTYIEGRFIAETPVNDDLMEDFGRFLGSLGRQLSKYRNVEIEALHSSWDMQYFDEYGPFLEYLDSAYRKKLVRHYLLRFRDRVKPEQHRLRKSIIHNDANDWNVLTDGKKIKGIIDFSDMVYSSSIHELAVAAAYMAMDTEEPIRRIIPLVSGYHESFPLKREEIILLDDMIAARLCMSVCQSAKSRAMDPKNQYTSIHEEKAWDLLDRWIALSPVYKQQAFLEACGYDVHRTKSNGLFAQKREEYFSRSLSLSYERPIVMESAAFQYMFGDGGRTYLDGVNNIMHVGHGHPVVVEAAARQMQQLNTNTRYHYDALIEYAGELLSKFPDNLNKVFFVNSGSAATDLALRLARNFTGRRDMMVLEQGYHGNTSAGIEVSHYKFAGKGGKGAEHHIRVAPLPDTFRGKFRKTDPDAGEKYAREAEKLIDGDLAGFISEAIVGCGGQVMLPKGYLPTVYRQVRQGGGVCLADEVQTGFGRTGTHFWAYEMHDVIPDIVILGKPIGNGHPLGAVVCTDEIATAFETGMEFFSSFGGNPVSCEIGKAVLQVLEEEELQSHALSTGHFLLDSFKQMRPLWPLIGDVRGTGLFLGIELVNDPSSLEPASDAAREIVQYMREKGILLSTDGPFNQVIKIKPPLCFSLENAETLVNTFEDALRHTRQGT